MTDLHNLNLRTTPQLLNRTTRTFFFNLSTFLSLSLLVLAFRTSVETGAHLATTYIDRDPSLQALLAKLDIAGSRVRSSETAAALRRRRRHRPFLHLTRVGTLDDDFFSGDDDDDRNIFGPRRKTKINGSYVKFSQFDRRLGFSEFVEDNGIRLSEIVRSGFSFNSDGLSFDSEDYGDGIDEGNGTISLANREEAAAGAGAGAGAGDGDGDGDTIVDSNFFVKGFDLGRHDSVALLVIASCMCAAYTWVIIGFLVTYTWVLGVVFVAVLNYLLGRYSSFVRTMWDGSRLGMRRLSAFILMRWALRDAFTQLLGLWFFGEVEDQYSFFRLFVRLKLMPFSIMAPWIRGFEKEISSFLFMWFLVDTVVAFIFALDPWAAIVDARRGGRNIVKEGCYLISLMFNQAFHIKCLEIIFCGSFMRLVLSRVCGKYVASFFQSLAEVYFMVAWLIFYFAAKCRDPSPNGRRFARRDLEGIVEGLG